MLVSVVLFVSGLWTTLNVYCSIIGPTDLPTLKSLLNALQTAQPNEKGKYEKRDLFRKQYHEYCNESPHNLSPWLNKTVERIARETKYDQHRQKTAVWWAARQIDCVRAIDYDEYENFFVQFAFNFSYSHELERVLENELTAYYDAYLRRVVDELFAIVNTTIDYRGPSAEKLTYLLSVLGQDEKFEEMKEDDRMKRVWKFLKGARSFSNEEWIGKIRSLEDIDVVVDHRTPLNLLVNYQKQVGTDLSQLPRKIVESFYKADPSFDSLLNKAGLLRLQNYRANYQKQCKDEPEPMSMKWFKGYFDAIAQAFLDEPTKSDNGLQEIITALLEGFHHLPCPYSVSYNDDSFKRVLQYTYHFRQKITTTKFDPTGRLFKLYSDHFGELMRVHGGFYPFTTDCREFAKIRIVIDAINNDYLQSSDAVKKLHIYRIVFAGKFLINGLADWHSQESQMIDCNGNKNAQEDSSRSILASYMDKHDISINVHYSLVLAEFSRALVKSFYSGDGEFDNFLGGKGKHLGELRRAVSGQCPSFDPFKSAWFRKQVDNAISKLAAPIHFPEIKPFDRYVVDLWRAYSSLSCPISIGYPQAKVEPIKTYYLPTSSAFSNDQTLITMYDQKLASAGKAILFKAKTTMSEMPDDGKRILAVDAYDNDYLDASDAEKQAKMEQAIRKDDNLIYKMGFLKKSLELKDHVMTLYTDLVPNIPSNSILNAFRKQFKSRCKDFDPFSSAWFREQFSQAAQFDDFRYRLSYVWWSLRQLDCPHSITLPVTNDNDFLIQAFNVPYVVIRNITSQTETLEDIFVDQCEDPVLDVLEYIHVDDTKWLDLNEKLRLAICHVESGIKLEAGYNYHEHMKHFLSCLYRSHTPLGAYIRDHKLITEATFTSIATIIPKTAYGFLRVSDEYDSNIRALAKDTLLSFTQSLPRYDQYIAKSSLRDLTKFRTKYIELCSKDQCDPLASQWISDNFEEIVKKYEKGKIYLNEMINELWEIFRYTPRAVEAGYNESVMSAAYHFSPKDKFSRKAVLQTYYTKYLKAIVRDIFKDLPNDGAIDRVEKYKETLAVHAYDSDLMTTKDVKKLNACVIEFFTKGIFAKDSDLEKLKKELMARLNKLARENVTASLAPAQRPTVNVSQPVKPSSNVSSPEPPSKPQRSIFTMREPSEQKAGTKLKNQRFSLSTLPKTVYAALIVVGAVLVFLSLSMCCALPNADRLDEYTSH